MTFNLHELAKEQIRSERKAELVKKYRDTRSHLIQTQKELEAARKKCEGLASALTKLEKEAEDELGEEWHWR